MSNNNGYLRVSLEINGKKRKVYVHQLVARDFIPTVEGKDIVDHIDRDRCNNCKDNLRWVNSSENSQNREKKENTSSKYKGVYWNKVNN